MGRGGDHVGVESPIDVTAQVEKASLCDADGDAISAPFVSARGLRSRGH